MLLRSRRLGIGAAFGLAVVTLVLGCDLSAPPTYAVRGKVQLAGGDVKQLAGAHVEAVLASDLRVLASGEIQEDGSFALGTIFAGQVLDGAQEGEYQVRIVLSDEDRGSRRRKGRVLAPRFAQFKSSGLFFDVPPNGDVTLKLSQR
jgi:hypothetical protein